MLFAAFPAIFCHPIKMRVSNYRNCNSRGYTHQLVVFNCSHDLITQGRIVSGQLEVKLHYFYLTTLWIKVSTRGELNELIGNIGGPRDSSQCLHNM
jgi:hypothetical protein